MARFHSSLSPLPSSQPLATRRDGGRHSLGRPALLAWGQWEGLPTPPLANGLGGLSRDQDAREGRALHETSSKSPAREVAVAAGHLAFSLAGLVAPLVLLLLAS